MKIDFDFGAIKSAEFGAGIYAGDKQKYYRMAVDLKVQDSLKEMAGETKSEMVAFDGGPTLYNPGEKYASLDYVYIPATNKLGAGSRELYDATNIPVNRHALDRTDDMFAYFARFTDTSGRRLTAVRRASQFKGILKSRLIRIGTDALKIVEERVFRLDHDFDYLVDSANTHILRPTAFEYVHGLQKAIMEAVPANIVVLRADVPFVDFTNLEEYAKVHPRAARYVASICSLKETANIDKAALRKQCEKTGVAIGHANGMVTVDAGNEIGFLEVLDRRRYAVELVKNQPERYRAASRDKI